MSELNNTTAGEVSYPDDYTAFEAMIQGGKTEAAEPSEDSNESESAEESEPSDDKEPGKEKPEDEESDKPESKRGIHKRFSKLTKEIADLKAELARTRSSEVKPEVAKPPSAPEGKPSADKFDSWDEYNEALVEWKLEQRIAAERDAQYRRAEQERQQAAADVWTTRIEKAKESMADFEDVLESAEDIEFGPAVAQALMDSEKGPEIAYHLAKNRAEAERIAQLSPVAAIREIGKIEAKLSVTPKPKPRVSAAPEPITPVTKPSTSRAMRFDDPDVDFATFERAANKRFNS